MSAEGAWTDKLSGVAGMHFRLFPQPCTIDQSGSLSTLLFYGLSQTWIQSATEITDKNMFKNTPPPPPGTPRPWWLQQAQITSSPTGLRLLRVPSPPKENTARGRARLASERREPWFSGPRQEKQRQLPHHGIPDAKAARRPSGEPIAGPHSSRGL